MMSDYMFLCLFVVLPCCYSSVQDNILNHLGTKTPYRIIANHEIGDYNFSDCVPGKIWMMVRHGTRYPGKDDINFLNKELPLIRSQILQNHLNNKGSLTCKQLDDFRDWSIRLSPEEEKHLQHEGEDEMINLAERMKSRFPILLSEKYDNATYQFRYTATQRTQQSAINFAIGLFGRRNAMDVWYPAAGSSDIVLRSYRMCPRWRVEVKKNPETLSERKLFGESDLMLKTIKEVSERLGLDEVLSLVSVHKMYKICAFETAWLKRIESPWCHSFDMSNIKVIEYYDDLKYYWIDGYGKKLTTKLSCPTVKDFMGHILSEDGPVVSVSFSHSGTILKLLTHLGLWRTDEHLTHKSIDPHRPWKVSKIDAFASNIALVRYRCEIEKDYIMILHQEKPVLLPGCGSILCPMKLVTKNLQHSLDNCDFNGMCKV